MTTSKSKKAFVRRQEEILASPFYEMNFSEVMLIRDVPRLSGEETGKDKEVQEEAQETFPRQPLSQDYFLAAYKVFLRELRWLKRTEEKITPEEAAELHHFLDTLLMTKELLEEERRGKLKV